MMATEPVGCERGVVVWSHARDLLRTFRPQMWVVLQDLALDAEWRDGRLVASSSARLVAEHLHIDPGTAAAALRGAARPGSRRAVPDIGSGGTLRTRLLHLAIATGAGDDLSTTVGNAAWGQAAHGATPRGETACGEVVHGAGAHRPC